MNKRVLTIVVECDQDLLERQWIWDSHLKCQYINGLKVTAIADGDLTTICHSCKLELENSEDGDDDE